MNQLISQTATVFFILIAMCAASPLNGMLQPIKAPAPEARHPPAPVIPTQFNGAFVGNYHIPMPDGSLLEYSISGRVYYDYEAQKERVDIVAPSSVISAIVDFGASSPEEYVLALVNGQLSCSEIVLPSFLKLPSPKILESATFAGTSEMQGHGFVNAWLLSMGPFQMTLITPASGDTWKLIAAFTDIFEFRYTEMAKGGISSSTFDVPSQCKDGTLPGYSTDISNAMASAMGATMSPAASPRV